MGMHRHAGGGRRARRRTAAAAATTPTLAFPATLDALAAERRPAWRALLLALAAVLCLAAAGVVAVLPAPQVEQASEAHVEAAAGALELVAAATARIGATALRLGATVRAGDVLVQLEPPPELLAAWRQDAARAASCAAQAAALARQLAAAGGGERSGRMESRAAAAQAAAATAEAAAAAGLAADRAARSAQLQALGLAPDAALAQARTEAEERRQAALAATAAGRRRELQDQGASMTRAAAVAELERQLAAVRGEAAVAAAGAARWAAQLERLRLRAPCDGLLATVAALPAGSTVAAGQPLAVLVPAGPLKIVGTLDAGALGRVRAGQPALFWPRRCPPPGCRGVPAAVTAVAGEAHDGGLRVELALVASGSSRQATPPAAPPLRHGEGLAALEIEVGRQAPIAVLWRGLVSPDHAWVSR